MAANFIHPDWVMSAEEFRAFWGPTRLAAVGTSSPDGHPHSAPVEVDLTGDRFVIPTFANTLRLVDLRANSRVVLTAWDGPYHAAIVYGLVELHEASAGLVPVSVRPTRIYAIRAPAGHHAHRAH